MKRNLIMVVTIIAAFLVLLLNPFQMNNDQNIIFSILILTIMWWTTGVVNRGYSSILLIIVFIIFSGASLRKIFMFPLSTNFVLIVLSFVFSQGIVRSNLAKRISYYVLVKYGGNPYRIVLLSFVFGIFLVFIIPQPFPRVILLSHIYIENFKKSNLKESSRQALLFSIYVASTCTSMLFLNGDVLLNYSALQFGEIALSWLEWSKYMTFPSLLVCILMAGLYLLIFRKDLKGTKFHQLSDCDSPKALDKKEKWAMIIVIMVIILWMTEPIHSINPAISIVIGIVLMMSGKLVEFKDFKKINFNLLLFLTAAFSIGGVMKEMGIAEMIYSNIVKYIVGGSMGFYIMPIISIAMILHMFLGSAITTLSITIPALITMFAGEISTIALTLLAYIVVSIHYILPFHHATIMIGAGENQYTSIHTIKYGLGLTVLTFIVIKLIYIPWWKLIGLV